MCAWKHRFVSLAYCGQQRIPTTDFEKDELFVAGLGEKEVEFDQLDLDANGFRDVLLRAFPKLQDAGGFQLCKCPPNSRALEPLSTLACSSPSLLKQRVGQARTYIVPLQRDLDLSATVDVPQEV